MSLLGHAEFYSCSGQNTSNNNMDIFTGSNKRDIKLSRAHSEKLPGAVGSTLTRSPAKSSLLSTISIET